jgi:hypothetical protein
MGANPRGIARLMTTPKVACGPAIAPLHGEDVFGNVRADLRRAAAQRRKEKFHSAARASVWPKRAEDIQ